MQLPRLKELIAAGNPLGDRGADAPLQSNLDEASAGEHRPQQLLPAMRALDLGRCSLTRLPALLASCPELEDLRLGYNTISIPPSDEELLAIPTLLKADLGNNSIEAVPRRLVALP